MYLASIEDTQSSKYKSMNIQKPHFPIRNPVICMLLFSFVLFPNKPSPLCLPTPKACKHLRIAHEITSSLPILHLFSLYGSLCCLVLDN